MGFHLSTTPGRYSDADTFSDLPSAADNTGVVWLVWSTTGTIFVNRKRAGLYISDGANWKRLGLVQVSGTESPGFLPSNPPVGGCKITNLFVNPSTGKLEVRYDNVPIT